MSKNFIICLMGMDGSGKSTLARGLIDELQANGFQATYTWWLEGESTLFRRIVRKSLGNQKKSGLKQQEIVENIPKGIIKDLLLQKIYPRLVLLDYLIFGVTKTRIVNRHQIMVFDRYYYDTVFAISNEFQLSSSTRKHLLSLYKQCIPDPDLLLILNVSPEVAYGRKPEEFQALETAYLIWNSSKEIYDFVEKNVDSPVIKIDSSGDIGTSKKELLTVVLKELVR